MQANLIGGIIGGFIAVTLVSALYLMYLDDMMRSMGAVCR